LSIQTKSLRSGRNKPLGCVCLTGSLCCAKIEKENVNLVEEWNYFDDEIGKIEKFNINFFGYRKFSKEQIVTKIERYGD